VNSKIVEMDVLKHAEDSADRMSLRSAVETLKGNKAVTSGLQVKTLSRDGRPVRGQMGAIR
jgi:hypothetical protein